MYVDISILIACRCFVSRWKIRLFRSFQIVQATAAHYCFVVAPAALLQLRTTACVDGPTCDSTGCRARAVGHEQKRCSAVSWLAMAHMMQVGMAGQFLHLRFCVVWSLFCSSHMKNFILGGNGRNHNSFRRGFGMPELLRK
jgi:hypothetical protein